MKMTKLRVWWFRGYGTYRRVDYYDVGSVDEAIKRIEELTKEDLRNEGVISNAGGLEVYENGEWLEYYDDVGRDISEIIEDRKNESK